MAGPWEQYQTPTATPEAAPWLAYQGQAATGEHGYAPAPPKPEPAAPSVIPWNPVGDELGNIYTPQPPPSLGDMRDAVAPPPTSWLPDWLAKGPAWLPDSLSKPPTSKLDFGKIGGAMREGWRGPVSLLPPGSDEAGQESLWGPYVGGAINTLARIPLGIPNALTYGTAEYANQASGDPRLGRDVNMGAQVLAALYPLRGRIPSPLEMTAAPRVNPNMKGFTEQTAALREADEAARRYGPPEAPRQAPPSIEPQDPVVASGIIGTQQQLGIREAPPPPPPSPIPAEAVPPGVPPGTAVPESLRIKAAIDATQPPPPSFVPQTNRDPFTGQVTPVRVPPGAAGPEAVPYAPPTPEAAPVAAPAEAPGPRSAGAAGTPFADATLTPEQAAAAGSTADKQWLYQTAVPGEADNTVYLKGINPTMAQREQTVNAARDSKLLRRISAEAEQNERALLAEHTNIRKGEFQDIAGSDVTHEAEMKAASDQIETQLQAAYAHGGTVDLQPVIAAANAELRGSAGKLPPVKAAMKAIIDAAEKSDGSGLETDPRQANAVRRAIIYMQSREGKLENPGYGHPDTLAALTRVKDVLTKQVEPAAPGFTEANANYAKARQATDAKEALQKYEPRLYDNLNNMRYNAFHNMMKEIIAARDPNAPLNPWKSLTEEQMNRLKSVHDDLKRAASAEDLARANGSDTTQTLFDLAKRAARHATGTGAGAVVGFGVSHILGPEAGMAAGMFTKDAVTHMFEKGAVDRATAEHNKLLHPDPTKYPTRPNPMFDPNGQY